MVKHYNDHAANERSFLAWVRTSNCSYTLHTLYCRRSRASRPALDQLWYAWAVSRDRFSTD